MPSGCGFGGAAGGAAPDGGFARGAVDDGGAIGGGAVCVAGPPGGGLKSEGGLDNITPGTGGGGGKGDADALCAGLAWLTGVEDLGGPAALGGGGKLEAAGLALFGSFLFTHRFSSLS